MLSLSLSITYWMCKKLLSNGLGAQKKQARVLSHHEEEKLWETGAMWTGRPVGQQNAIFFYCGMYFCLRGGSDHWLLKLSQFKVTEVEDPSNSSRMIECVTYCEHSSKNHEGLVHQVHLEIKTVSHFANESLKEHCFVHLFELSTSKLPEAAKKKDLSTAHQGWKWVKIEWYYSLPIGHNILGHKLRDVLWCWYWLLVWKTFKTTVPVDRKATGIIPVYEKGVPKKKIMKMSGHHSTGGVRSMSALQKNRKKQVSEVLSGCHVPLCVLNTNNCKQVDGSTSEEKLKENDRKSTICDVQGCTFNFTFN